MADVALLGLPEGDVDAPEGVTGDLNPPEPAFIVLFPRGVDAGEEEGVDNSPMRLFRNSSITRVATFGGTGIMFNEGVAMSNRS